MALGVPFLLAGSWRSPGDAQVRGEVQSRRGASAGNTVRAHRAGVFDQRRGRTRTQSADRQHKFACLRRRAAAPAIANGGLAAKQCVAEFVIQPRQLMQGNAVMRALTPTDHRFEAGDVSGIAGGTQDPFEYSLDPVHPRLTLCMRCHAGASRIGLQTTRPPLLKEVSPKAISKATSARNP